jgi:hypothetical protein
MSSNAPESWFNLYVPPFSAWTIHWSLIDFNLPFNHSSCALVYGASRRRGRRVRSLVTETKTMLTEQCDHQQPTCSLCEKAREDCTYPSETYRRYVGLSTYLFVAHLMERTYSWICQGCRATVGGIGKSSELRTRTGRGAKGVLWSSCELSPSC